MVIAPTSANALSTWSASSQSSKLTARLYDAVPAL
jgi:hypothetical protein